MTSVDEEFKRFKQVREELNLTQSAFAQQLGISSTTADIERGRMRIPGHAVKELLRKYHINPLWLFGDSSQKYLYADKKHIDPKIVTVDHEGVENILMVNAKAAAGYPHNIGDPEWFESLPAFSIPLPEYRNATFRGFQVDGDSMQPSLFSGEWIMAKAETEWEHISFKNMYVVVTGDSVLVKKIRKEADPSRVTLISLNPQYPPIPVDASEIREIWAVNSKLTFDLDGGQGISLQSLHDEMKALREDFRNLANK